ncbi:MAG: AAA family ATPase [Chloroflexi bacterium]|nr:AAA family ATPase [Chloroflexota bacterium]
MPLILHAKYLGKFELNSLADHDSRPDPLRLPPTLKSQSLLAYLIYNQDRAHVREHLIDMFWGSSPPAKGRRSLSTALWHIRRCFPEQNLLQGDSQSIRFSFPGRVQIDSRQFENKFSNPTFRDYQDAVAQYHGEFLDGFFDDWIINERFRLQTLYFEALSFLMQAYEKQGDYRKSIQTAFRLLRHNPLREDAHRGVMRAYAHLGQRNAALSHFKQAQETIARELDIAPMDETVALCESIRDGKFRTREHDPVEVAATDSPPAGLDLLDVRTALPVIGRQRDLDALHAAWTAVTTDQRERVVFVQGEAGLGKTCLVKAFARDLHKDGIHAVWGQCYEFEHRFPYQPFVEIVQAIVSQRAQFPLLQLPPWCVSEVARLVPQILEQHRGLPQAAAQSADFEQARLFSGLSCFLAHVSHNRPLAIILEDLHLASDSTLELLLYLTRSLDGHPVLIVGTFRADLLETGPALPGLVEQADATKAVKTVQLHPLSFEDVQDLLRLISGREETTAALAERLYRESEGNPFFLTELLKALFESGHVSMTDGTWQVDSSFLDDGNFPLPASLSEAVLSRVARLGAKAQAALQAASVLGREFDHDPLQAILGGDEEATLKALDEMLRHKLIATSSGASPCDYAFTHHKIQEVVYASIPRRRKLRLHQQVGLALEKLRTKTTGIATLPWHFERAEEPRLAARYALQAGQKAKRVFAHAEARSYFDRALALLTQEAAYLRDEEEIASNQQLRIAALEERGWALRLLGDMQAYANDLKEEARLADSLKGEKNLAHLRWREAYAHRWFCRYQEAQTAAEEGIRLGRAAADPMLEALCLRETGMAARETGDHPLAKKTLEQALALFGKQNETVYEVHTLCNLATLYLQTKQPAKAIELCRLALDLCNRAGLHLQRRLPLGDLGAASITQGRYQAARDFLTKSLAIARRITDRTQEILCLGHLGHLSLAENAANNAIERFEAALSLAKNIHSLTEQSWLLLGLAKARYAGGDRNAAVQLTDQALELGRTTGRIQDEKAAQSFWGEISKHQ